MIKKFWREIVVVVVCVAVIVTTAVLYSTFTSRYIYDENSKHLIEIADQVNDKFGQTVENNRKILQGWRHYINTVVDIIHDDPDNAEAREKELDDFIIAQEAQWNFTDLYFIGMNEHVDENAGERYNNLVEARSWKQDKTVNFRFRRKLSDVIANNDGGVVGTLEGDDTRIMLFAADFSEPDESICSGNHRLEYKGFQYYAIGISFGAEDIQSLLSVDAFEGTGICYVVLPNGNVLLQSGSRHVVNIDNFIDFMSAENQVTLVGKTVEDIQKDWNEQNTATMLFTDNSLGTQYYFTYQPVGFGDWMFIVMVPAATVNGRMDWFRNVTVSVMAAIFAIVCVAVAWVIITKSRRKSQENEMKIKSRDQLFDLLTLNSNDIFILFSGVDYTSEYVSTNIKQVLGIDVEAVQNDVRAVLASVMNGPELLDSDSLEKLGDGDTWEVDLQMRHVEKDTQYWFHLTLYRSNHSAKNSYILMFSDRTKEHQMAENLESALDIAKSANEAKSNFLSNMSHDIRTPMNAIIGFSTLLAKDAEKPDKVREYVRKISFSGQHLLSLINDILDMSKIESGKTTLNIEPFNLSEMLEELYAMTAAQAKAKMQTFEVHAKGHLPDVVLGDKLRINQIILNLLSNAMKYTPEKGNIELGVELLDPNIHKHVHLRITVQDNGFGMSEDFVKHIFEPFAREVTASTEKIQGTGLGMSITKNIVDLMGGTIAVESELGKGSKFTVELELAAAAADDDDEFWTRNNVTRVLVVDDEEDICLNVVDLMDGTGVDVHYATSGKQSIEMVKSALADNEEYNIILLDWKMPEMNGIETARAIRKIVGDEVPIMVLTSYNFDEIEEEARDAGIDLFLPKPFFVSNFRNAIGKLRGGDTRDLKNAPEKISLEGLHVLAAEDNEINAEILVELLEVEGVTCDIASNGQIVLEQFENSKPGQYDFIFMDVQMPIMNGYESTRAIRACSHPDAKTIPIIAMTANAFDDDVKKAIDSGMNAHLAKPIDMDKLKKIVADIRDGKAGK